MTGPSAVSSRDGWRGGLLKAAATTAVLALAATACGSSGKKDEAATTTTAPPKPGGGIVVATTAEIDTFTPGTARWTSSGLFTAKAVLDPLATFDDKGEAVPYLAESFTPNSGFTEWTIKLRSGVNFTDGTPVNAEAVMANLEAVRKSPLTGNVYRDVTGIEKVDDLTVKVTLSRGWAELPGVFAYQTGFIVAPAQLADPKGGDNPIGSGPFQVKKWNKGDTLALVKNPGYWQKDASGIQLPYLDSVDYKVVNDPQTRINGVSTGEFDLIATDNSESVINLAKTGSTDQVKVLVDESEGTEFHVLFNNTTGPFANKDLRIAAAEAIDRKDMVQSLFNGFYDVANGPFKDGSAWGAATNYPAYNPDDAKARVQAAGGGQPVKIVLATTNAPEEARLAQYVQEKWNAVGFDVQLLQLDEAAGASKLVTKDFEALMFNFWYQADPDGMSHYWTSKSPAGGPNILNFAQYNSATVDEALAAARLTNDPAQRKAEYAKVWEDFGANVPYLWLYHSKWVIAYNARLGGVGDFTLPGGQKAQPVTWGGVFLTAVWIAT